MDRQIFVKNSSRDINFGYYDLEDILFRTDGGRLYLDKEYFAKIEVNDKTYKMRITLYEKDPGKKNT